MIRVNIKSFYNPTFQIQKLDVDKYLLTSLFIDSLIYVFIYYLVIVHCKFLLENFVSLKFHV